MYELKDKMISRKISTKNSVYKYTYMNGKKGS